MNRDNKCPICNGLKKEGKVTFTVDLGENLIIVRNTPAKICALCGEEWIDDEVSEKLEEIVKEAKEKLK